MPGTDQSAWIQTRTGRKFSLFATRAEDVEIRDIAHALSNLCRFTGHCAEFYSVAEHSLRVSFRCAELVYAILDQPEFGGGEEDLREPARQAARWGLLHDASEAYLGDVARPLKHSTGMEEYRQAETAVQLRVCERFGLPVAAPPEVHVADDELLWTEVRDLMVPLHPEWRTTVKEPREPLPHVRVAAWAPQKARHMFLRRFAELFPEFSSGPEGEAP